jgi:hypothetical protein
MAAGPLKINAGLTFSDNTTQTSAAISGLSGPQVIAYCSTAQTLVHDSPTIINADTVSSDTATMVTTGASWHATIPVGQSGTYWVSATQHILMGSGSAYNIFLSVYVNGAEVRRFGRLAGQTPAISSVVGVTGSALVSLSAGDTVDFRLYVSNGGVSNFTLESSSTENFVYIEKWR